jgi:Tfp pilus assembly protein PilZ
MSEEQRREKRIATRQRLWCEGQEASPLNAETRDVSRNGMFIVAENAPDVGEQLKVTLKDQDGEVTLNMEVMWRGTKADEENKTGIGVRIVGFDKGRDLYERFITRHLRPSGRPPAPPLPMEPGQPTFRPSRGPTRPRPSTPPPKT